MVRIKPSQSIYINVLFVFVTILENGVFRSSQTSTDCTLNFAMVSLFSYTYSSAQVLVDLQICALYAGMVSV